MNLNYIHEALKELDSLHGKKRPLKEEKECKGPECKPEEEEKKEEKEPLMEEEPVEEPIEAEIAVEEKTPLEVIKDKIDIHGEEGKIIIAEKGQLDNPDAPKIEVKITDEEKEILEPEFHEEPAEEEEAVVEEVKEEEPSEEEKVEVSVEEKPAEEAPVEQPAEEFVFTGERIPEEEREGIRKVSFPADYNRTVRVHVGDENLELVGIPDNAFKGCVNLEEVHIPALIKAIGFHAFNGCDNIKIFFEPREDSLKVWPQDVEFIKAHMAE